MNDTKEKAKKKRSWPIRILRALAFVVLVPVLLVAILVAYIHTDSGQERIRALVEARASAKMNGGHFKLGSLRFALFGDLELRDVEIQDATGQKAVSVARLRVVPAWGKLGGEGPIPLEALELEGVTVSVVKDEQGGNNFKNLFQPIELKKGVAIDRVDISGVDVAILSPDGTKIAVSGVQVQGAVLARSAIKTYKVDLSRLAANVVIDKPASGLTVGVKDLQTGLRVDIEGGKGKVELLPLSAEVALVVKPRNIDRTIPVKLGGLAIELGDGQIGADLDQLALGLLTLSAIEARVPMAEGKLAGVPSAEVLGLRVVGKEVNALLGKEVLQTDVDVDVHVGGSGDTTTLKAHIAAGPAEVDVDGNVTGATGPRPAFELKTTVKNVDTSKLLGSGVTVPPASLEELTIEAKGNGKELASLDAEVRVDGKNARVRGVDIDSVNAAAVMSGGKVEVKKLDVRAIDQHVTLAGSITPGSKEVDMKLHLDGDVDAALARMGPAGVLLSTKIPKGALTLPKDDLEVGLKGRLDGRLRITAKAERLRALGSNLALDVDATVLRGDKDKGEKPVTLESLDARVRLTGILLSRVLALRGRKMPKGFDATIDVDLHATGTIEDPKAKLRVSGKTIRETIEGKKLPRMALRVDADVTKHAAHADLKLSNLDAIEDTLLRAKVKLPLSLEGEKKGLAPGGRIQAEVEIPRRTLMNLAGYTPFMPLEPLSPLAILAPVLEKPNGEIAMRATFDGTVADPRGTVDLDLSLARVFGEDSKQDFKLAARVDKDPAGGTKADAKLTVSLDEAPKPALAVDANVKFPVSPLLGGAARMSYDARVAVGPLPFESLPKAPQLDRVRALGGTVGVALNVKGNRQDLAADLSVDARGLKPGGKGPFDATVRVAVLPDKTNVAAAVATDRSDLLKIGGHVGLGGEGLLARVKQPGFEAPLDLALEVPERPLSSLAKLRENLAGAPGTLSGKIVVSGTTKTPKAAGAVGLYGVEMADGSRRGVAAHLTVDDTRAGLALKLGATGAAPDATALGSIDVGVARDDISAYRSGDPLPIDATISMKNAPIGAVVPAMVAKDARSAFAGNIDWDMKAHVEIEKGDKGTELNRADLDGKLTLSNARFLIPGTKRKLDRVSLDLSVGGDRVHLKGLEAHESDKDVADRWLKIDGEVALEKLKPTKANLHLAANKWLLFGAAVLGPADAPRGTLDLDARATLELDRAIRTVDVDVKKLVVWIPDRFDKAHQPEEVHAGDVFFVGKGPALGKLKVPSPSPSPSPSPETGTDIHVRIAKGAKLLQSPMELHPHGTITVKIRPSGRTIAGRLTIDGGELSLGGKMHQLTRGSLTFDERRQGWIDLWFKKGLPPWALRNVSAASGGNGIEIHMFGPISDRRTVLAGAGPGALYDLLSLHNTGRERFYAEADLAESDAVEFPQHNGLLTLSFLSVNLPHLLFLDRVAAWSDPVGAPETYGQLRHYEGDRYFADGHGRIRATRRPADVGRSEAEVEALYLFENTPQLLFGVGGAAGSRGGGGPGVVLEWSSER